MIKALMRFVDYEKQDKLQILEDVTPPRSPPSPILSSSPGLFFARFSTRSEVDEEEDDDDMPFSPCSASTPQKSETSPLSQRLKQFGCNERSEHTTGDRNPHSTYSICLPKRPLKRKGLSVVDTNAPSSAPNNKRFRFEEHAVDYSRIERVEKRQREEREERRLEDARWSEHEWREEKRWEDARWGVESLKRRVNGLLRMEAEEMHEKQLEVRLDEVEREQEEIRRRVAALDTIPDRSSGLQSGGNNLASAFLSNQVRPPTLSLRDQLRVDCRYDRKTNPLPGGRVYALRGLSNPIYLYPAIVVEADETSVTVEFLRDQSQETLYLREIVHIRDVVAGKMVEVTQNSTNPRVQGEIIEPLLGISQFCVEIGGVETNVYWTDIVLHRVEFDV